MKKQLQVKTAFLFFFMVGIIFSCTTDEQIVPNNSNIEKFDFSYEDDGNIIQFPSYDIFQKTILEYHQDQNRFKEYLKDFQSLSKKINRLMEENPKGPKTENLEFDKYLSIIKDDEGIKRMEITYSFASMSPFLNENEIIKIGEMYVRFTDQLGQTHQK